jgi:hypothetical protein
MGRTNVLDQPSPGYARASLWTTADIPIPMQLSDEFQIFIETPSAGTVSIFNGIISDIEISLDVIRIRGINFDLHNNGGRTVGIATT